MLFVCVAIAPKQLLSRARTARVSRARRIKALSLAGVSLKIAGHTWLVSPWLYIVII